jgi:hypothetical protein
MPTSPGDLSSAVTTDAERVELEKILLRHPIEGLLSRLAVQWNPVKGSPPLPSNEKVPWPPSYREIVWRGRLLSALIILMAARGLSPAEISAALMDQGLKRPIRPGLSKPLVTPALVEGILASWRSSRELELNVSQRLRHAAPCRVFASPEELQPELQRRFAELVNRCCNEPGRIDHVPPQESVAGGQARGDRRHEGKSTNALVKEALGRNPNATSVDISKAIGRSDKTVRRSRAWGERPKTQAQDRPESMDALDRSRPLTRPMLAAIDSGAPDPAEIVADREEEDQAEGIEPIDRLRARFVAESTPGQRARLDRLPRAEQESELRAWAITGKFLPDEPNAPGPLRGRNRRPIADRSERSVSAH